MPTTIDEMVAAGAEAEGRQRRHPNFSGIYLPGKNWFAALPFIWDDGGDIAVQEGDAWKGMLASDESVAGPDRSSRSSSSETSGAPKDGDDSKDYIAFCNGEVGMMTAPGWKPGQIINPDDGCPDMEANIGAFAHAGPHRRHHVARVPRRLEPGDLGQQREPRAGLRPAEDPGRRTDYQKQFAEQGTIPALKSLLGSISGSEAADGAGQGRREQPLRAVQRELGRGRGEQHPARHARRHRPVAPT